MNLWHRIWAWSVALLLAGGSCAWATTPNPALFNGFDVRDALVPAEQILRGGPPRDGIPAIDEPVFVAPAEAALRDDDRVLGIHHDGIARAYPVAIMNWHEVVNDRFGQTAIAVTYCPLCGTGMAFHADIDGTPHAFGVSGLLYNSDVLLYDRRTDSLWSQIMRTAVTGPMKGWRLQPVPMAHTSWADWLAHHPDTQVLSTRTGFSRDYSRDPYAGYDRVQRLIFDVNHRDDRFPLKAWVLGLETATVSKAYPFSELEKAVDADGFMDDTLAGQSVRIRYDATHHTAQAFDSDGQTLPSVMAFWFAWVAFHPQTEVFQSRPSESAASGNIKPARR